jgi:hypothetical protein
MQSKRRLRDSTTLHQCETSIIQRMEKPVIHLRNIPTHTVDMGFLCTYYAHKVIKVTKKSEKKLTCPFNPTSSMYKFFNSNP